MSQIWQYYSRVTVKGYNMTLHTYTTNQCPYKVSTSYTIWFPGRVGVKSFEDLDLNPFVIRIKALPGYMDTAIYNVMYFSTEMWLHFRNVATNLIGHICSHISEM